MMKKWTLLILLSGLLLSSNIDKLVETARDQVGKTVTYNPEYVKLRYPMGDIDISRGVCTDVVVRSL